MRNAICSCCCRSRSRSGSSTMATSSPRCRSPIRRSLWILVRCLWIARADRPLAVSPSGPSGCSPPRRCSSPGSGSVSTSRSSNVIDVGYSGVHRRRPDRPRPEPVRPLSRSRTPQPKCGPADDSGEVRDRIQTNGRCETANPLGDTYGPVSYLAYIPGYAIFGWSHKWDSLPAVHLDLDPLRLSLPARPRARRPPLRGAATRGHARVRLGRLAVHASTRRARTRTTRSRPPS